MSKWKVNWFTPYGPAQHVVEGDTEEKAIEAFKAEVSYRPNDQAIAERDPDCFSIQKV